MSTRALVKIIRNEVKWNLSLLMPVMINVEDG
jgi:hypothetical protein